MSRGRPRHQASRRRLYSARQREVRERRARDLRQQEYWLSDQVAAIEIEEGLDFESPTSWSSRAAGRSAADRMERAGAEFHARVAAAFRAAERGEWQAAHPECGRIVAIDASGTEDDVADRVSSVVGQAFPELAVGAAAEAS